MANSFAGKEAVFLNVFANPVRPIGAASVVNKTSLINCRFFIGKILILVYVDRVS
jgi:hypothetical protein